MKFSVSSYSYLRYMLTTGADYYEICDHAKKAGFDGVFDKDKIAIVLDHFVPIRI